MAYRAPELFDVKTGVTIDEKVDIWVRISTLALFHTPLFETEYSPDSVSWVHSLRARIPPFAFRDSCNDRAGWIDCDGCHECAVQTPNQLCIFSGLEGFNRQYVEAGSKSAARYPSGTFCLKALLLAILTGCVGYRAS